jgi:beta-lactam-binding protein with PASTA domain
MLTDYLIIYLVFVMAAALLVSLLVLRLKLPSPQIIIPVVIALIIIPALAGYVYVIYFAALPDVIVPDLKGWPVSSAMAKLQTLNLRGRAAGTISETEIPLGCVVSQRPEAGRRVKIGRLINFLTSSGERSVTVPNLLGQTAEQAATALLEKGLAAAISYEYSQGVDPGIVVGQSPLPGETLNTGASVEVTVSTVEGGDSP